jgi:hypothetical protein
MKKRKKISFLIVAVGLLAIVAWFITMPYPVSMWWQAKLNSRYSSAWPVSWLEYTSAKLAVLPELHFREIITDVTVVSSTEIRFATLAYWEGDLASSGRTVIAKKVDGWWTVKRGRTSWISSNDTRGTQPPVADNGSQVRRI